MKKGALFTTIGSIIILVISFIAFVLPSQLGSAAAAQKKEVFGKYKNREVRYEKNSDLVNNLQSVQNEYYNTYGQEPDNSTFFNNFYQAFKMTLSQYAYEEAVKKSGYVVAEETVNRKLRSLFQDENGNFSMALYNQADTQAVAEYKSQLLNAGYSNRMAEDLFGSQTDMIGPSTLYGLKQSEAEMDFLADYETNLRAFNMICFDKGTYPDAQVLSFAEKNSGKFTKYNLSIITYADKSDADKAAKKMADGKTTFETAASEVTSKYCDSEGKLIYPYYYQYRLERLLNDAADINTLASLKNDEVSAVVELTDGYAIFKKVAAEDKADFTVDATLKDVRTYLSTYESDIIEDYFINRAKDFKKAALATDFDEACESVNVTKIEIPAFALNYGGSSFGKSIDSTLPGLEFADENETFLRTAFSLKENEYSDPIIMKGTSSGYVVLIQYVPTDLEDEDTEMNVKPFLAYQIAGYDNSAAMNSILKSKDVTDNFTMAYYGF